MFEGILSNLKGGKIGEQNAERQRQQELLRFLTTQNPQEKAFAAGALVNSGVSLRDLAAMESANVERQALESSAQFQNSYMQNLANRRGNQKLPFEALSPQASMPIESSNDGAANIAALRQEREEAEVGLLNDTTKPIAQSRLSEIDRRITQAEKDARSQELPATQAEELRTNYQELSAADMAIDTLKQEIQKAPSDFGVVGMGKSLGQTAVGVAEDIASVTGLGGVRNALQKGREAVGGEAGGVARLKPMENTLASALVRARTVGGRPTAEIVKRAQADAALTGLSSSAAVAEKLQSIQDEIRRSKKMIEERGRIGGAKLSESKQAKPVEYDFNPQTGEFNARR